MKIIITTVDPDAEKFISEVTRDGYVGWNCSPECEGTSIKVETIISYDGEVPA